MPWRRDKTATTETSSPVRRAYAASFVAILAWGLAPVATRYAVTRLSVAATLLLRFTVATVVLGGMLRGLDLRRLLAERRMILGPAITGVAGYNGAVAVGLQWTSASTAALLLSSEPLLILIIARLLTRERVSPRSWIGAAIALVGVAVITASRLSPRGEAHQHPILGAVLVLVAAVAFAAYVVTLRPLALRYGAVRATAITTVVGSVPLLALTGVFVSGAQLARVTPATGGAVLGLALGSTVFAMALWNHGAMTLTATRLGPMLNLIPVVGVAGAAILLNESVSAVTVAGAGLIGAGVWVAAPVASGVGARRRGVAADRADLGEQ
jgi:drug/metabolite transporter (DMT)-like permease